MLKPTVNFSRISMSTHSYFLSATEYYTIYNWNEPLPIIFDFLYSLKKDNEKYTFIHLFNTFQYQLNRIISI